MTEYGYEDPRSIYSEENLKRARTCTPEEVLERIRREPDRMTVNALRAYWCNPDDGKNSPLSYLSGSIMQRRSKALVSFVRHILPDRNTTILELGCGTGRNLHYLHAAGYHNLLGIELSPKYLEALREHFPHLSGLVLQGPIEDILPQLPNTYDLVFSMAVLEHIPPEIEVQVFGSIHTHTTWLLTIEDECCDTWNHFPRNYKEVFPKYGFDHIKSWRYPPLGAAFVMRLFRKEGEK